MGGARPRSALGRRPLIVEIAGRYLRGRRSRLLGSTARAALVSIFIGVAAMVVAMALMAGYTEDLQRKLIGGGAALVAYPQTAEGILESDLAAIEGLESVVGVARVSYVQGSISRRGAAATYDVTLRGVDPEAVVMGFDGSLLDPADGIAGTVVGEELLERLAATVGDELTLMAINTDTRRFRYVRLRITGTFASGFAEADRAWLVVRRSLAEELGGRSPLVEITLEDPLNTSVALDEVSGLLAGRYLVSDWREFNRDLFTALQLQKTALFFVLGLIVVVSTFNVSSSLVVLTRERQREIGVLSALGLLPGQIRRLFLLCGVALGAVGALAGALAGAFLSWFLTTFEIVRFSDPGVAAIYFISSVPFRVRPEDIAAVLGWTLFATLAACWLPARRASKLIAADAMRFQ